ncbi:MATE family efflux transporter [Thioclava sp. GXIMD4216]|uniref:MATE family efflux transporter n=1 Tax=unclassified Thioclava TaxID=2621713 RepID=UPI0030CB9919
MGAFGHMRAILTLGLPLVGSNLAAAGLGVTDTIMMGWYGVPELAAVVLGTNYLFFFFLFGTGFANAIIGRVSMALGANDETQARRDTRMALWLSVLTGLVSIPCMWHSAAVLQALGQAPETARLAQDYLRIAGLGIVPMLVVAVLRSYLSAFERTQIVLWVTLSAVGLNIVCNWLLIFGEMGFPEMGVRGAALSSVLVQTVSMLVLMVYAHRARGLSHVALWQRFWRPDWSAFGAVARMGIPIGLTILAEASMFQMAALMMGWLGTIELAANGIVMETSVLAFMLHMGLANAATVRAGRAYGAGAPEHLRRGAITVICMSLVIVAVTVTAFLGIPEKIVSLFLKPGGDSAQILLLASGLLALAGLFQLFDAMQVLAMGLLRGLQDTRVPMWIALASYWLVGIPTGYVLAFHVGLQSHGVWLGLAAGLATASSLLMYRFWVVRGGGRRPMA